MKTAAETLRLLYNLIRTGVITDVDHTAARARVKTGHNHTDWLPWITARAGKTRQWNPPTQGEQVVLFSPGGDLGQGIILTGLFSSDHSAPSDKAEEHRWEYPDGTTMSYDYKQHRLEVVVTGDAQLTVEGDCELSVKGSLNAKVEESLSAEVNGTASLTAGGNVSVKATGTASVEASTIDLNGGAGVVTGAHICAYTGSPHSDCSSSVKAEK